MGGEVKVSRERDGRVLVLEILGTDARNSLSKAMLVQIIEALTTLPPDVGAVLLTGSNGIFCAGADGSESIEAVGHGWEGPFADLVETTRVALRTVARCPVPLVAALDGQASGIGLTCALLADVRIATPRSKLLVTTTQAGFPLDGGLSFTLARALGPTQALRSPSIPTASRARTCSTEALRCGP